NFDVSMHDNGNILFVWESLNQDGPYQYNVYGKMINIDGAPIKNTFLVFQDTLRHRQRYPKCATDNNNSFLITWTEEASDKPGIYCRRFTINGDASGERFKVDDDNLNFPGRYPAIAVKNDGNYLITWSNRIDENKALLGQLVSDQDEKKGLNFFINRNKINTFTDQENIETALWNNNIISTWSLSLPYSSRDEIWANILDWENISGLNNTGTSSQPAKFQLMQNYPNPFNPSTTIRYSIPEKAHLEINVYNASGKKVKTLFDGIKQSGEYSIRFDGDGLSSGIYFVQMTSAGFRKSVKTLLIK
ncbi:MAG: T9SS type A sorting domain-containing protein, partial [Calditrichaeota bacterium]|nr:T9SS type A sorting domain-containing protein [Calditrichota bacterium]